VVVRLEYVATVLAMRNDQVVALKSWRLAIVA
jgi:hypothetical protein